MSFEVFTMISRAVSISATEGYWRSANNTNSFDKVIPPAERLTEV
jgi:hypothetical protein